MRHLCPKGTQCGSDLDQLFGVGRIMSFVVFLTCVLASQVVGHSLEDYSSFGDEFFLEEGLNTESQAEVINATKNTSELIGKAIPVITPQYLFKETEEFNPETLSLSLAGDASDKHLVDHFSQLQNVDYNRYEDSFQKEGSTHTNASQTRREINNWEPPDGYFKPENAPWSYDVFYPNEKHVKNDVGEQDAPKPTSPVTPRTDTYLDYYSNEDLKEISRGLNRRRNIKKSPCKLYLEFLKYAFQQLDDDYDYGDGWGGKETTQKPHKNPTTQAFQPTTPGRPSWSKTTLNANVTTAGTTKPAFQHESFSASVSRTSTKSGAEAFKTKHPETTFWSNIEPQSGEHKYRTTMQVNSEEEKTMFGDYDYRDVNTPASPTTVSSEFYRRMANALAKTGGVTSSPADWGETDPTTPQPPGVYTNKPAGDDCNDKMLPCPDTINITYPLNGYCNRYVSCESGRAIRRTCSDGLHFNIVTKSCDLPHNSFCTYACPKADGYYGVPGDCGGYFFCKDFVSEYRMCPPKMHWDIQKGTCTFPEESSCPMKCSKSSEVKHYSGDCKAYIICINGIPFYHKCPPSTIFDKNALTCVPAHLSKCEDDPRLLTKTLNPNHLCKDIEVKVGSKVWCSFFEKTDKSKFEN